VSYFCISSDRYEVYGRSEELDEDVQIFKWLFTQLSKTEHIKQDALTLKKDTWVGKAGVMPYEK
jgi:hypothetical protein